MIRVDTRPRKRNAPRPAWKVEKSFHQWLRGRPCACAGRNPDCSGVMHAAHVDYAAKGTPEAKGMASKVGDRWAIPLSADCHHLQHAKGWPWFDTRILGGTGRGEMMAAEYWRLWKGDKGELADG
jgi:hypothetical protein